ncbi:MAG: hypothetical protein ACKO85_21040 [Isosphaeraceae bacterium]
MSGPGSLGNIIAALCSVFVPGLGQLVQGRILKAAFLFVTASVLWLFMLGWLVHIWAIWDAAVWRPREYRITNGHIHRNHGQTELYYTMKAPAEHISL